MFKKIKRYFYTGLIALLPIILTVYIFNWIVGIMMKLLGNSFITILINKILLNLVQENEFVFYFNVLVYFTSLVTMILGVCLVGFTLRIVLFANLIKIIEKFFIKIPLVKQVYTTISQIIELTMSNKEKSYQKVVMVEYPRKGIYSIGFLTSENNHLIKNELKSEEEFYNVFIPTSPNPTSGMFIIVKRSDVRILESVKIDDAIRLIISGGVILPPEEEKENCIEK